MTITEAIEILAQLADYGNYPHTPEAESALKLGIEASKLYRHNRLIGAHHDPDLLPGETEE